MGADRIRTYDPLIRSYEVDISRVSYAVPTHSGPPAFSIYFPNIYRITSVLRRPETVQPDAEIMLPHIDNVEMKIIRSGVAVNLTDSAIKKTI